MKLLIIGDSHGNIRNLKHVMGFGKNINVGAVIHTGDWNNLAAVETVYSYNIPVYGVLGNADIGPEIKDRFKDFLKFEIDGKKIYVIHEFLKSDENYRHCDIVFTGHYHSQSVLEQNGVRIIRPGALENGINFAIYDTSINKVEFISE